MWFPSRHAFAAVPVLATLAASGSAAVGLSLGLVGAPNVAVPTFPPSRVSEASVVTAPPTMPVPSVADEPVVGPPATPTREPDVAPRASRPPVDPDPAQRRATPRTTSSNPDPQEASDPDRARLREDVGRWAVRDACRRGYLAGSFCGGG